MKHLKKFQTNADYQAFRGGGDWVTPNISIIVEDDSIVYEPLVEVKTINYIRISYEEYAPDEYEVIFRADFKPASTIHFELDGNSAGLDTNITITKLKNIWGVPALERLTYSPKEDDTYIYEVVINNTTLIMFTVNGTEYQAEEDMTWKEWCNSEYNTGGFKYSSGDVGDAIYTSDYKKYFIHPISELDLVTTGVYLTKTVDWPR